MENRKIGEPIGHVDASRRPYAAFVLRNPLLGNTDLVGYAGLLEVQKSDSNVLKREYADLSLELSNRVRGLPISGPTIEDTDIICYSGLNRAAGAVFDEIKKNSDSARLKMSYGGATAGMQTSTMLTYMHLLRDVPLDEQRKIFEEGLLAGLYGYESWKRLGTEDLRKVVQRGKEWAEREVKKYHSIQDLGHTERKAGRRMPEGIELGKMLEARLGLDYGGYEWKPLAQRSTPPYFSDGIQAVNVIVGKHELIPFLEREIIAREN